MGSERDPGLLGSAVGVREAPVTELARELPIGLSEAARNWREVLLTGNLSADRRVDVVSRWLLMTRAAVFPMTLVSGAIGGLLALGHPDANVGLFMLAVVGLLAAHAANNLMNDYFDLAGGVDTKTYPRALYAPHPVLSGWITREGLLAAIVVVNAIGAAVAWALWRARGDAILPFAILGLFLSVFYVAPPLRLKHHGLGEPSVFLVWGPLMIGGTYAVTTGEIEPWVLGASVPYALLTTAVLVGKHIDKLPYDGPKGIHTLPVILGERPSLALNRAMMIAFYPAVLISIALGWFGPWCALVLFSIPLLRRVLDVYSKPPPAAPPPRYPIWPLWYVAAAFVVARRAGGLLVLGLFLDHFLPLV